MTALVWALFGIIYTLYGALVAWLNTREQLHALTGHDLFHALEVVIGTTLMLAHLWALLGMDVFVTALLIACAAGAPMIAGLLVAHLVKTARAQSAAEAASVAAEIASR